MRANLVEIFTSIQGEGPYVGATTTFVRFGGCDLRCRWCDSSGTWQAARSWRLESEPGRARFETRSNPVETDEILRLLRRHDLGRVAFVSATGGEPLLQARAVAALAEGLRDDAPRFWLETHGLHVEALESVVEHVDLVSMDWKLESEVGWAAANTDSFAPRHRAFLEIALRAAECIVKCVVTPQTEDAEWEAVCRQIASVSRDVLFVVQPVTPLTNPFGTVSARPSAQRLMALQGAAEAHLRNVRVIPQTHPILDAL